MRIAEIVGNWLVTCVVYSAIGALSLGAVLLADYFMGHRLHVPFWIATLLILVIGVVASLPNLVRGLRKDRPNQ
jgi:hypothetical protein